MDYGMIYENDNIDIWFEPITDEIDGFVVYNKDHSINSIYTPTGVGEWLKYIKSKDIL